MTIAFATLGCKVNYYETEKILGQCRQKGFKIVDFDEKADVYVINTCTVTNVADRKSQKTIRRARKANPDALVIAVGCYVESAKKALETGDCVDMMIGNKQKDQIADIIASHMRESKRVPASREDVDEPSPRREKGGRTRAYVKIQDGCNQFCTYCIIPHVRGRLTSKPVKDVLEEVKGLVDEGYKEVVLSGIHLSSYGVDRADAGNFVGLGGAPLLGLIKEMGRLEGLERIRLGSLEPRLITEGFIGQVALMPKICHHFHLSLQSGCDKTLRRMNRQYTTKEYEAACSHIRRRLPHPAITTDVIVGFPGETDAEFEETMRFVQRMAFARIHVFPYSVRKGTKACELPDHVCAKVKKERGRALSALEESLRHAYMESFLGTRQQILIEEAVEREDGTYYVGRNERYVRVAVRTERGQINETIEVVPTGFMDADALLGDAAISTSEGGSTI